MQCIGDRPVTNTPQVEAKTIVDVGRRSSVGATRTHVGVPIILERLMNFSIRHLLAFAVFGLSLTVVNVVWS